MIKQATWKPFCLVGWNTFYASRSACQERVEVFENGRMVDRICDNRLETPQPRFVFNLTASQVTLKYFTARGQYQAAADVGFWVSFRQLQGKISRVVFLGSQSKFLLAHFYQTKSAYRQVSNISRTLVGN